VGSKEPLRPVVQIEVMAACEGEEIKFELARKTRAKNPNDTIRFLIPTMRKDSPNKIVAEILKKPPEILAFTRQFNVDRSFYTMVV
jgi:histidine ammonia-lyase